MDRLIEVKVHGNFVTKDSKNAGTQGEYNITTMRIEFDPGWDGYAKTITFFNAYGENPVERTLTADLLEDITESIRIYRVKIPGEPLEEAGKCSFVIDGYIEGVLQRSVEDRLVVKAAHDTRDAGEPEDPTPTQAEQLQLQIDTLLGDMQEQAIIAHTAAENAKASEEAAAISEGHALTSENTAAIYADRAVSSASAASGSETRASNYANAAYDSARAASYSSSAAASSAVDAEGFAQAAEVSARSAEASADEAYTAAGAAAQSAEFASNSEKNVAASATQAANAKESAAVYAAEAGTASSNAAKSEAAAKASASNAAASESSARAAEVNAANSRDAAYTYASNAQQASYTAEEWAEASIVAAKEAAASAEEAKNAAAGGGGGGGDASAQIAEHNTDAAAHSDIRQAASNAASAAVAAQTTANAAVKRSGDRMTGTLTATAFDIDRNNTYAAFTINTRYKGAALETSDDSAEGCALIVSTSAGMLFMDPTGKTYPVIHTGNLAQYSGVAPASLEN